MERTLLIVGASARAAAFSAIRAGLRPTVADRFADWDLTRLCRATRVDRYPEGIVSFLRSSPPETPWMYTGAMENRPDLIQAMASSRRLLGNGPGTLRLVRDPTILSDSLRRAGFLVPECRREGDDVPADGSWLRKPIASAGGGGITVWRGPSHAGDQSGRASYLQWRVAGLSCAAVYVAAGQRAVLIGMARQLTGAAWCGTRSFHYSGSVGPFHPTPRLRASLNRLGNGLSRQFGLIGLFGVDLILQGDRAWTVEVNPRYTASIEVLERGLGISAISLHVAACVRGSLPRPATGRADGIPNGKAIVYADHDTVIARSLTTTPPAVRWPVLADIPPLGTHIGSGEPVATVFADGRHFTEVIERLQRRAVELRGRVFPAQLTVSTADRPAAAETPRAQPDEQSR
ncbi:MAG: ATP-grasp domain-containing protein [Pirellulales bacterium]